MAKEQPATSSVVAAAGAGIEDSWFWESEPTTSATTGSSASSASHKDAIAASGGDLTTIPLGSTSRANDDATAQLHDFEQTVKHLRIENAILNEKLGQLNEELRTSASTVEQLDKDHSEAIEELLTLKDAAQTKCKRIEKELLTLKEEQQVTAERFAQEVALAEELQQKLSAKAEEVDRLLAAAASLAKEREFEFIEKEKTPEPDYLAKILELENQIAVLTTSKQDIEHELQSKSNELLTQVSDLKASKSDLEDRLGHIQQLKQEQELVKLELEFQLKDQKNEYDDQLEVSKARFTEQLAVLQEQLLSQDELQRHITELEGQLMQSHSVESKQLLDTDHEHDVNQQLAELLSRHRALERTHEKLLQDHDQLLDDAAPRTTDEEFEQFKVTASECESKLVQENVVLQKQLVDLQSSLNARRSSSDLPETSITLSEFGSRLQQYVRIDSSKTSFDEILKYLGETLTSIDRTKRDVDELTEKLEQLTVDKMRVEHEKQTAQADLMHYEVEVAELMKNNEILLLELDALKTGKLETISEQDEENIIQLEQQLEDCSNLNQSLEDEYEDMRTRLAEMERQLANRDAEVTTHARRLAEVLLQLENAESEKSNLTFELAELKANDKSADAIDEVRAKEITLRADNEKLKQQLEAEATAAAKRVVDIQSEVDSLTEQLSEKTELLAKKSADVQDLVEQLRSARTQDPNAELESKIAELNQIIHTMQTTPNPTHAAEVAELRHVLESTIAEKNQLITLITAKHEENSTYHAEIKRLTQCLADETNRPRECPVCPQTAVQLAALRDRDEKYSDQVTFLREKADILTANLMTEQANQTRMVQQREQVLAEKAELHRDVERLRAHLLEVEESHTQETMELQRVIDEVTMKMGNIETEAKKTSTAYTSAR